MNTQANSRTHSRANSRASVHVRDLLRGMRYAVRKSGNFLLDPAHQVLPDPLGDLTSRAVRKLDHLSEELERASSVLGGPFQKSTSPETSFFSERGYRADTHAGETGASASVLYYGLYYAFKKLSGYDVLISETLCLDCIQALESADIDDNNQTPDQDAPDLFAPTYASRLFALITDQQVFRQHPVRAKHDDAQSQAITTASFAVALWFFVPRDLDTADEQALLDICCEVTQAHADEVIRLQENPDASEALFRRLLSMI